MLKNSTIEVNDNRFRFNVDVYLFNEQGHMTVYCPSLDIATTGTDFQDAIKNFYECLQLYATFRTLLRRPQLSALMQSNTNYKRISAPIRIATLA